MKFLQYGRLANLPTMQDDQVPKSEIEVVGECLRPQTVSPQVINCSVGVDKIVLRKCTPRTKEKNKGIQLSFFIFILKIFLICITSSWRSHIAKINYAFGPLRSIYVNSKYYQRGEGLSPKIYHDNVVGKGGGEIRECPCFAKSMSHLV